MTILTIAGLDVGNDEELQRVLQKIYRTGKRVSVLVVNERQLEFIGDSYELYGETLRGDNGKLREALYFDPGYNEIELRIDGDE
jgi:hypothetical protein